MFSRWCQWISFQHTTPISGQNLTNNLCPFNLKVAWVSSYTLGLDVIWRVWEIHRIYNVWHQFAQTVMKSYDCVSQFFSANKSCTKIAFNIIWWNERQKSLLNAAAAFSLIFGSIDLWAHIQAMFNMCVTYPNISKQFLSSITHTAADNKHPGGIRPPTGRKCQTFSRQKNQLVPLLIQKPPAYHE